MIEVTLNKCWFKAPCPPHHKSTFNVPDHENITSPLFTIYSFGISFEPLSEFESNYEFLFGRTNFFYDANGHFEKAYRVWKHAHNLEFDTFSKDEKVKFYSEQKDFCVYDVTSKITKEYQLNFIDEPFTAYSELNTVSKFAKAWFESVKGKMEFNDPNDSIYFELFVFAVFKYGKLK